MVNVKIIFLQENNTNVLLYRNSKYRIKICFVRKCRDQDGDCVQAAVDQRDFDHILAHRAPLTYHLRHHHVQGVLF